MEILEQLQTNNEVVGSFEKRFDGLEERFDGLENRFDGLEKEVDGLKTAIHELKEGQIDLSDEVKTLYDNTLWQVGEYTNRVDNDFDQRLTELSSSSDNQEKMIHTLASRSIQHESDIHELKQKL